MTDTTDITTLVDGYIAAFNEADPDRRRSIIDRTWSDDARYLDPLMSGDGPDRIDAMIAGVQQQFPGHRFALSGAPDAHHDRVRFTWTLAPEAGGDAIAVGVDFGTLAGDGRLREVTGFLEPN